MALRTSPENSRIFRIVRRRVQPSFLEVNARLNTLWRPIAGPGPAWGPAVLASLKYRLAACHGQQYPSTNPRFFIAFRHSVNDGFLASVLIAHKPRSPTCNAPELSISPQIRSPFTWDCMVMNP
jgi:hypothetical protein